jgi:seryl-tRNA synthetase
MTSIRFESPVRLKETVVSALREKLVYTAPGVSAVAITPVEGGKPVIELAYEGALSEAELIEKASQLVREFARGFLEVEKEILHDRRHVVPAWSEPVYEAMKEAGWVVEYETGRVMLAGPAARLFAFFDAEFARLARDYDAPPVKFPVLISVKTLQKADYFASFPHHLTLASHLVEDAEVLKDLVKTASENPEAISFGGPCLCTEHVNSPAVCFHFYEALSGRRLEGVERSTAVGPSFRYEAGNLRTLERLWDFTMREIIFVGPSDEVDALRMSAMAPVMALVEALGLRSHIETASDPFFVGNFAGQTFYQLSHRTKFELRLYLPFETDRSLAAASFNWHQQFFGTRFGITTAAGEPAGTACVAFGVERWVYAFAAQYGLDPRNYPKYLLERW